MRAFGDDFHGGGDGFFRGGSFFFRDWRELLFDGFVHGIQFGSVGFVAQVHRLKVCKGSVDDFLHGSIRNEGDFVVLADLEAFSGVDVDAFSFVDGDQFESSQSFDFHELVIGQSLLYDLKECAEEGLRFFFGDAFLFGEPLREV